MVLTVGLLNQQSNRYLWTAKLDTIPLGRPSGDPFIAWMLIFQWHQLFPRPPVRPPPAPAPGTPSWLVEEPHSPPRTPVTPLGGQPRGRLNVLAQRVFAKKTVQDLLSGSAPVDSRERCRQQRRRFHNWLTENFDGESAATSPRSATPPHARGNAQAVKWEGQASPKCSSQWFEDVRREGAGVQLLRSLRTPMSSMWDSLGASSLARV